MKLNRILLSSLFLASMGFVATGCSDSFLDEEQLNRKNLDYYKSEDGINDLITGTYSTLGWKFNYSWGYGLYNMGVDEYTDANNEVASMNGYSTLISTEGTYIPGLADNMYNRIEAANRAIENIPLYYSKALDSYNTRLGEAYFFRAYCYFELVKTYGAMPLKLKSTESDKDTYFPRNTEDECFAQIISDFTQAYELLPVKPEAQGRVTKYAAAHFLAKAKLTRASELYSGWNSSYISSDLNDVIKLTKEVIAAHPLCADFASLWNYTKPDDANESVSEIVLAAQFTLDEATQGRFGNQAHLAFPAVYQDMAGTKRDISGDREFCYLRTTNYTLDVYDRVNDSRFWKTFITCYGCNDTKGAPTYEAGQAAFLPAGVSAGNKRFVGGELGIRYIINDAGDNEYQQLVYKDEKGNEVRAEGQVTRNGVMQAPHTFVRYFAGEEQNWVTGHGNYGNYAQKKRFVANGKHRDGARNAIASQFGTRDAIVARSAEDVLMCAEAYARKKEYAKVVEMINMLRERAGYAEGEDRSIHVDGGGAYVNNTACAGKGGGYSADGAIYTTANTYYESNKIEEVTTESTKDKMLLTDVNDILNSEIDNKIFAALKATGGEMFKGDEEYQKVMNFILNERTRELTGEYTRWEDLARQRQLEVRHKAFNDAGVRGQGTFNPKVHYYRPIPQGLLDALTDESGKSLSSDAKAAYQNPGY
ncbi:MAG: RagB/SusD family nutrient uptake outer membrane protein [Bacteroidaceae bacterium]|nr:RagB/SusD family nutrient uptake outer membrane protein [Bacteroidaceae bacterium]